LRLESSGTQTWLQLLGPALSTLRGRRVLVVDELDARLHPILVGHLIKLFQDPRTNRHGSQLIFNTHNVSLLGPGALCRLRRDQVWFTERNEEWSTLLYPLTEYRIRDGLDNVEKGYIRGRYGAIPNIDELLAVRTFEGAEGVDSSEESR